MTTLRNIVDIGHLSDVHAKFTEIHDRARRLSEYISALERNEANLVFRNLTLYVEQQSGRLAEWLEQPIDMIAWATRNLYETNLICRFVLHAPKNLIEFINQRATDELEMLEGLVALNPNPKDTNLDVLKRRIDVIKAVLTKHGRSPSKHLSVSALAKSAGLEAEYISFFKFYSKYVHPSSWSRNAPTETVDNLDYRNILWLKAQLYSQHTLNEIANRVQFSFHTENKM